MGADVQIVRQLTVKQHGPTFATFGPKIFRYFSARKQRVNLWPDVVRNPIQRLYFLVLCNFQLVNHLHVKLQLNYAMQGARKDKPVASQ